MQPSNPRPPTRPKRWPLPGGWTLEAPGYLLSTVERDGEAQEAALLQQLRDAQSGGQFYNAAG